jgi:Ca2+-binding RTX toxin-like protein
VINGNTSWEKQSTAGAYGVVFLAGELNLLSLLGLQVSGYILLSEEVMSLELNLYAGLNFLNLVKASVYGSVFFSSQGEFEVEVFAGVQLGPNGFNISGSAYLWISYLDSDGKGSEGDDNRILDVTGSLSVSATVFWINLGSIDLTVDYDGDSGDITVSVGVLVPYIAKSCWDTIFGRICIYYPSFHQKYYSFTIGNLRLTPPDIPPTPVVLGQVNSDGILTLNVGLYAADRNLMVDEEDEGVLIERVSADSEKGEKIRITMFGHSQEFDNVLGILIEDMAAGEDYVEIYASVTVPAEVHFGADSDSLTCAGPGMVTAYGDEGDDNLEGGSGNDWLFGGLGNDILDGKAGQDWIEGGDGADVLIGGADSDTLKGGPDFDRIAGDLAEFTGDETTSILETISSASGGNDMIEGGEGPDAIFGGSGNDQIEGGQGDDTLVGDDGTVIISVVDYDISISFTLTDLDFSGNDIIAGSADNDTLFGQKGEDILLGGEGNDHLYGDGYALGTETVRNILLGDGGTITLVDGLVTEINTIGESTGGTDTIYGNGGADIVMGGAAWDEIYGDAGDDILLGDTGIIVLYNGSLVYVDKEDEEFGGSDTIHGDMGNDIIIGGLNSSSDTLYGNAGDDIILGDNGIIDFNIDADPLTLDLIRSATDGFGGDDYIYGNAGSDVILGGTGDDEIHGDDDPDILIGDNADIFLSGFVPGSLTILGSAVNEIVSTDTGESTGGADTITGNEASDIIIGGVNGSSDTLYGNDGDDVILGDNGLLDFAYDGDDDLTTLDLMCSFTDGLGGGDFIYGNAGDDVLIGGTGGDRIDGNEGKDLILGDNGVLTYTNGDTSNPRFRILQGTMIYGETPGVNDGLPLIDRDYQFNDPAGIPQWANWEVTLSVDSGGPDYIAGGPDNDQIFGQGGNDIIQGDGTILMAVIAYRDTDGLLVVSASVEDPSDGDDYIEGNDGDDIIFGNLGQDDIIGGSSELFGLDTAAERTDGEDMIFGGAGTVLDLARNNQGDTSANGHARDADVILGDNGNIYRLVGTNVTDSGGFLEFNYDNYSTEKIIVRAAELLDYTPGGLDYDAVNAVNDIGAPDEIHGESGDDFLYGMKGDDVIFGEGQDDDIIGGYGNDWISGGTGDDGVLGDDGRIYTSRNGIVEPLYGISDLAGEFDKDISTQDKKQQATINVSGELKKTVNLTPFKLGDPEVPQYLDEFDQADDIIFGGWGNDFLHGGDGDDAISGAEVLTEYYDNPVNQGDVLKYGVYREGEFGAYNKDDPLSKVYWDPATGEFVTGGTVEFLLNFDHTEGPAVNAVDTDGDDVIFGDLGNDWLVGGTGRDHMYGGRGCDLLNADDDLDTAGGANNEPNGSETSYEDLAYGGAGPDVLIANIIGDRLIDWVGDFNRYVLPYISFGANTISRNLKSKLFEFLYDLSRADGSDRTLGDSDDPRNGEPNGELGLVAQKDPDWENQTSDG